VLVVGNVGSESDKGKLFQELTSTAGEDVVFAMNAFIKRLLAVSDPEQMKVRESYAYLSCMAEE
jgi:hypothetical protein